MAGAGFKVVIPARYGSSRLPGKPLADILGRPMIAHVVAAGEASGADEVVVATDDARIAEAVQAFGGAVCMTRADHRSGTDRLAEVVERHGWPDDTRVVNLQGDEPLMPPELLDQVARDLEAHPDAGLATLKTPIRDAGEFHDPHVVKVVTDRAGYALYFSRAPIPWERDVFELEHQANAQCFRHLGLYAYRAGFLRRFAAGEPCALERIEQLEQLRALFDGTRIRVSEAACPAGHGVDTEADLERVRAILRERSGPGGPAVTRR